MLEVGASSARYAIRVRWDAASATADAPTPLESATSSASADSDGGGTVLGMALGIEDSGIAFAAEPSVCQVSFYVKSKYGPAPPPLPRSRRTVSLISVVQANKLKS